MRESSNVAEVATIPFPARFEFADVAYPDDKRDRPPYRYLVDGDDHYVVQLHGRHVADLRRNVAGGWDLFSTQDPQLAIGWAGSLAAMQQVVPTALTWPAANPQPSGVYAWFTVRFCRVEIYLCPIAQPAAA
jgi:hypothetical protein